MVVIANYNNYIAAILCSSRYANGFIMMKQMMWPSVVLGDIDNKIHRYDT